jgi:hypothetical protein
MRFHHLTSLVISASLGAAAVPARAAPPTTCAQHADCGGQSAYCYKGACEQLGQLESFLSLFLTAPVQAPAYVFIDGAAVGELPWEGVVTPGMHTIRVESVGMQTLELQGASNPASIDTIPLTMQPAGPAAPTVASPSAAAKEGRGAPGAIFVAAAGGIGAGTAFMTDHTRPATTLLVGGSVGLNIPKIPIWLDLGVAASGTMTKLSKWEVDGKQMAFTDFVKLDLGLLVRLLFPLKKNFFYLGGELEPGFAISNQNYVYAGLRLAMSLFPNELVEIRINPAGGEYIQSLSKDNAGYIISFQATLGIAVRFPKKPLF